MAARSAGDAEKSVPIGWTPGADGAGWRNRPGRIRDIRSSSNEQWGRWERQGDESVKNPLQHHPKCMLTEEAQKGPAGWQEDRDTSKEEE